MINATQLYRSLSWIRVRSGSDHSEFGCIRKFVVWIAFLIGVKLKQRKSEDIPERMLSLKLPAHFPVFGWTGTMATWRGEGYR